jgi:hypothetical protein
MLMKEFNLGGWLPFLDTYRTLCVMPTPEFEEVLQETRTRAA